MNLIFPEGEILIDDPNKYTLLKYLNEEKTVKLNLFYNEFLNIHNNRPFLDFNNLIKTENHHNALCYFGAEDQLKQFYKNIYLHEKAEIENQIFKFFEKHLEKLDWRNFFKKHLEKLDWRNLSRNPNIPLDFFKKHLEKLDWRNLSRNPNIPLDFFKKHLEKLDWRCLCMNPNIPIWFIEKHLDKVRLGKSI